MTNREVFCADAIEWLKQYVPEDNISLVASLPDISEFPSFSLTQWKEWFVMTSELILSKCSENGVVIFFQTDIKYEDQWVDKAYLCQKAAESQGCYQLWHKIFCRAPVGAATFGRPAYSHMVCFTKNVKIDMSKSLPDVIPGLGDKTWERGMGIEATLLAARFMAEQTPTKNHSSFLWRRGMLAAANAYNLDAIGIERSPKRAEKARRMFITDTKKYVLND